LIPHHHHHHSTKPNNTLETTAPNKKENQNFSTATSDIARHIRFNVLNRESNDQTNVQYY